MKAIKECKEFLISLKERIIPKTTVANLLEENKKLANQVRLKQITIAQLQKRIRRLERQLR